MNLTKAKDFSFDKLKGDGKGKQSRRGGGKEHRGGGKNSSSDKPRKPRRSKKSD